MLVDQIQAAVKQAGNVREAMPEILATLLKLTDCSTGTIHERQGEALHLVAAQGVPEPLLAKVTHIPWGKGMAGEAARIGKPVQTCNLQTDNAGGVIKDGAKASGVAGSIALPMFRGERVEGTLGVATTVPRAFTEGEIEELLAVGRVLAEALAR